MSKINLENLPKEIVFEVFKLLPYRDLKSTTQVCKKLQIIGTDPLLWKKFPISGMKISQHQSLSRLLDVIQLPRFKKLQVLSLDRVFLCSYSDSAIKRKMFMEILVAASKLPLSWLDLSYNDLSKLQSQDFIAEVVLKIKNVDLYNTTAIKTKPNFICKMLEKFSNTSKLSKLNLGACDLERVPVELLIKLNGLEKLALEGAYMSKKQAKAFLTEMAQNTKIKTLDMGDEPIADIETLSDVLQNLEPSLVATSLNKVEFLIYKKMLNEEDDVCDYPPDLHLASFLEVMGENTNLKQVDMDENNYFFVPPEVVAKAFNNLERLFMKPSPYNTEAQIVAILQRMGRETKLKFVMFDYEDLSWLNPGLVARAVVNVEHVVMMCKLSKAHIKAILQEIDGKCLIRKLDLGQNDVSNVPKHILETSIKYLNKGGDGLIFLKNVGNKLFLKLRE